MPLVLVLVAIVVLALLTDGAALVPLWHFAVWCWSANPPVVTTLLVAWLCGCAAFFCSGRLWAERLHNHVIDAVRLNLRRPDPADRPPGADMPGADLVAFPLLRLVDEIQPPAADDTERAA